VLAAASVVGLIGGYAGMVLASTKRAGLLSLLLAILYAYLYVLLHLQDYALLLGSLGLFAILAGVMYLTRNVDWYAVNLSVKRE
jgi:inner membrane protein